MENTETNNNIKPGLAARVDESIYNAVVGIALEDERTISNTVERLLKTHPRVVEIVESVEPATAGAAQ